MISLSSNSGYTFLNTDNNIAEGALTLLKLKPSEKAPLSINTVREKTLDEIERLNSLPWVEYAQPNYIYKPLFTPEDEYYHYQWHYPLIKLDHVWGEYLINDVSNIIVAVIDTGIARSNGTISGNNHPDLGITETK